MLLVCRSFILSSVWNFAVLASAVLHFFSPFILLKMYSTLIIVYFSLEVYCMGIEGR